MSVHSTSLTSFLLVILLSISTLFVLERLRPEVLLIGNITIDIVDGNRTIGGAVSYAAAVLEAHGKQAHVVTTASNEVDLSIFQNHHLHIIPSNHTLTFAHTYTWWGHKRVLHVVERPSVSIGIHHVPLFWRFAKTVLIMPLLPSDVNAPEFLKWREFLKWILSQRIALAAQGFQRDTANDGKVFAYSSPHKDLLGSLGHGVSVFLSDVESDPWSVEELQQVVDGSDRLLITRGEKGALELTKPNNTADIPIIKVDNVIDTNGAGDTFATAYMLAMMEGESNPGLKAAKAASHIITKPQSCKPWCIAGDPLIKSTSETCDQQKTKRKFWKWSLINKKMIRFNVPFPSFFNRPTDS